MVTDKTQRLLKLIITTTQQILTTNLVGIYLHGSYVLGGYNERVSDLDYVIVVKRPLTIAEKQALLETTVTKLWPLAPAKGLEWHVLLLADTQYFKHPLPFELHFSKMHYVAYCQHPTAYIEQMHGSDGDLAAHLTIIRAAGQVLVGPAIRTVFGPVPPKDYWQSITVDVADTPTMMETQPMYTILNLCRVLAYQREGLILSKQAGGEWGMTHLDMQYRPLIKTALVEYGGTSSVPDYVADLAQRFARITLDKIRTD